jgi:hypothetical protein
VKITSIKIIGRRRKNEVLLLTKGMTNNYHQITRNSVRILSRGRIKIDENQHLFDQKDETVIMSFDELTTGRKTFKEKFM